MSPGLRNKLFYTLAILVLLDAFVFPDVRISSRLPAFQLTDFLWPLAILLILTNPRKVKINLWLLWLGLFSIYLVLPIALNDRLGEINDWFEIYKALKLGGLFLLFSYASTLDFTGFIRASFIGLVAINLLHFFDVLNFNHGMQEVYGSSIHWEFFGKDSEGNPAVKRMLGTLGNPNSNALLFLFFAVFFIPQENSWKAKAWFFSALLMVFMCQSRTSLLGCGAVIIYLLIVQYKQGNRYLLWQIPLMTAAVYCIGLMLSTSFFQYTGYSDSLLNGSAIHSNSLRSRWETWGILWDMIQAKPWFGYGPFKSFFSENHLYAENEYLLMWWRYGLFGLIFYLGILMIPFSLLLSKFTEPKNNRFVVFSAVMLLAALTNNPLTERSIGMLFVFLLALVYHKPNLREKTALDRQ